MLNVNGLENLGSDDVFEGWTIFAGALKTTGQFTVNESGELSQSGFICTTPFL